MPIHGKEFGEVTNDRDARRSGLARARATPHRLHLLARIADVVVTSGQSFPHAEQCLAVAPPQDSTECRGVGQANRDTRLT